MTMPRPGRPVRGSSTGRPLMAALDLRWPWLACPRLRHAATAAAPTGIRPFRLTVDHLVAALPMALTNPRRRTLALRDLADVPAAGTVAAIAQAADEAGKALAAGNLDVALAALETARDLAAQPILTGAGAALILRGDTVLARSRPGVCAAAQRSAVRAACLR